MGLTMLIGFAGGLAVLTSFGGVACGRLSAHSATYHALNLTGALAMVAAGLPADAWPSVAVNVSWALISGHGLAHALNAPVALSVGGGAATPGGAPARGSPIPRPPGVRSHPGPIAP